MILTAGLALMMSSCIEHHAVVTVNKDVSGTVTEETTMGCDGRTARPESRRAVKIC